MNDFGDLLGTPYAPVSKIAPVNGISLTQNPDFLEIPAVQQQRVFTEE